MSEDPSSSDSDGEYHTCDEADDDESVHQAASPSSSSSDDGRDYYHTSDDDDDDDDDVPGAASVISVKKETHQLYTSNITGLNRHVQEILETCGQPEQIRRHVQTSTSRQDGCKFAVSTPNMKQPLPLSWSPKDTLAPAGSGCRELIPTSRFEVDEDTFGEATTLYRQLVPTVDTLDQEGATAAGGCNARVLNVNVTQQWFRNTTVEKATNINQSFGGKQNISKTATYNEAGKSTELSKTDLIMKRTVEHFEAWNQGMVKTAALEKVLDKLEAGASWLTIKGNPGEGKTTVGFMALGELKRCGRQVFEVRSPEEFSEVISTCPRPVIMLDDVFGNLEFDQSKWSSWEPVVSPLLKELEHKSHEEECKTSKKGVTVLLVGRDYVLNSASIDLGRLSDPLKSDKYVVYMDHSLMRNMEEKRAIWNSISKSSGVHLDKSTIDEILKINVAHGFPHVCRLYVTLYKENKEIKAKEFFEKPLEFLNCSVENLFKDANNMHLFKETVKHERIGMRELRRLDPTYKLIQAAKSMVGSFLRVEDDSVLFDHPSIYDSVAFHLCLLDPVFVIQECKLGFIHERVRLQMSQNESANSESSLVVYVDSSYADELAERFSSEILKQNFYYVLSHQAFTDESFVSKVMSQVEMPFSKLLQLRDQTNSKNTFLRLVPSSKSPQFLKYLDNHPDIQLSEDDEKSLFYGTFKHAALHVLTYLIATRRSLNINVRFEYDCSATPLIIAAQTCDIQFIQQVLSLKPDLNASDESGRTALHYLCMKGLVSVVTQVVDGGAHINVREDRWNATPLCFACECNNLEIVKLLIKRGARVKVKALNSVCQNGNIDILKFLLDEKISLSETITTYNYILPPCNIPLIGKTNLLSASPTLSTCCMALLNTACRYNQPKVVEWLLKQNTDSGCKDKSQIRFKSAAPVDNNDIYRNSVIHKAAMWGSSDCVGVFLAAGADVNIRNVFGDTPLYKAVAYGQGECVGLLLKAGSDVNTQTYEEGESALHHAAKGGNKKFVDLLLAAGADVNIQENNGDTALHLAARKGSKDCVNVLLAAGANVNIQNEYGYAALHLAARIGSKECVDVLLTAGADFKIKDNRGDMPVITAARYGSEECASVLLRALLNRTIK